MNRLPKFNPMSSQLLSMVQLAVGGGNGSCRLKGLWQTERGASNPTTSNNCNRNWWSQKYTTTERGRWLPARSWTNDCTANDQTTRSEPKTQPYAPPKGDEDYVCMNEWSTIQGVIAAARHFPIIQQVKTISTIPSNKRFRYSLLLWFTRKVLGNFLEVKNKNIGRHDWSSETNPVWPCLEDFSCNNFSLVEVKDCDSTLKCTFPNIIQFHNFFIKLSLSKNYRSKVRAVPVDIKPSL